MNYRAYTNYSISDRTNNVKMPSHWDIKRLRHISGQVTVGVVVNPSHYVSDEGVPFLLGRDVREFKIDSENCNRCPPEVSNGVLRKSRLNTGDVVVVRVGEPGVAAVVPPELDGANCASMMIVRAHPSFDSRWIAYCFNSKVGRDQVEMVKYGAAQKVFNVSHAIDFAFPFPPLDEQRAIADFLDSETARIDELIVSKTKLRELLDQQRRALISQAVSTGLDACQHYRQTPVGQIPEHWSAAQLRRYAWMVTSGSRGWAEFYTDEGELFVRIGNLTRDSMCLDLTDVQRVSPPTGAEGERTRIRVGDVLFSITAYLGSVAVADIEAAGGYINQHIALVRLDTSRLVPEFLAYATLSEAGQSQLGGLGYGGTKIQLGLDDVKSLWIPVPPIAEQRAIVNYLDRQIKTISRLSAEIASAAVRVLEYRSALISAAVTGQIDVRNYRPQEAAAVCQ